ncbi:MAG: hypothetical protein KC646_17605 [Candidatus Cloacimonetes bacterium]|nr:hypothetical protein [Candidatus Cloacimonadota bacterium]
MKKIFLYSLFIAVLSVKSDICSELSEMKKTALKLIESNKKLIDYLRLQENNNFKILNEQGEWTKDKSHVIKLTPRQRVKKITPKFKLISGKKVRRKFKFINKMSKGKGLLTTSQLNQEFELLSDQEKTRFQETFPIYNFEVGLRNLSDGSGDGFSNDQELYFHVGKKVNKNREYFFEVKHANLGYEGDANIKRLGLGIKNYFSERDRRFKPYVCLGMDSVNTNFRSYQGTNIKDGYQTKYVGMARLGLDFDCSEKFAFNTFYERTGGTMRFDDVNGRVLTVNANKNIYGMGVKYKW